MNFNKWLDTFIEEKRIDTKLCFEFTSDEGNFHIMPVAVVIELIKGLDNDQKARIKNALVGIDFRNESVLEFLKGLAKIFV